MKTFNRISLFLPVITLLIAGNSYRTNAQVLQLDTSKNVSVIMEQLSWNITHLVSGIADNFIEFKGDSIATMDGNVAVYKVKGMPDMNADNQFIMKRADGSAYYVALFNGNQNRIRCYELTFRYGLSAYGKAKNIPMVCSKDWSNSDADKDTYGVTLDGVKVVSFIDEKKTKTLKLVIGLVK